MHEKWLEVAERQAGVISTAQLVAAGVGKAALRRLVRQRTLHRATRAVWVAPQVDRFNDPRLAGLWIALLGAGPGAFAWRRSAAALWELDGCPWPDRPEIAVAGSRHPRRAGIARLTVEPGTVADVTGAPATDVVRTLSDVAPVVDESTLERALESVLRRRLATVSDLRASIDGRRSAGASCLARVLQRRPAGLPPTESDAETLFALIARASGLPAPRRQFALLLQGRRHRIDFAWPEVRLAAEVDGSSVHGPDALDGDLRRQNAIVLDGWMVLRFTWSAVVHRPTEVRRDLRAAWGARSLLAVGRREGDLRPGPQWATGGVPNRPPVEH